MAAGAVHCLHPHPPGHCPPVNPGPPAPTLPEKRPPANRSWVIACAAPLHDALGADVAAAGCSCQLADGSLHAGCPTGLYGWRSTVQQPHLGQWVYAGGAGGVGAAMGPAAAGSHARLQRLHVGSKQGCMREPAGA